jgi:hypothetical protein
MEHSKEKYRKVQATEQTPSMLTQNLKSQKI